MSHADNVRLYCKKKYIEPARNQGQRIVEIRSGEVHAAMAYRNRYPLVCAALGTRIFEEMCGIRRIVVEGPLNGANTIFRFELLPSATEKVLD